MDRLLNLERMRGNLTCVDFCSVMLNGEKVAPTGDRICVCLPAIYMRDTELMTHT